MATLTLLAGTAKPNHDTRTTNIAGASYKLDMGLTQNKVCYQLQCPGIRTLLPNQYLCCERLCKQY